MAQLKKPDGTLRIYSPLVYARHGAPPGHDEVSRHACPDFSDAQLYRYQPVKGNDGSTANIPSLIAVFPFKEFKEFKEASASSGRS